MTETQEKASRYDIRQRGLELQRHLIVVKDQLDQYAKSWAKMISALRDHKYNSFAIDDSKITVIRPLPNTVMLPGHRPNVQPIASIPIYHFDSESLRELILDLETTKKELNDAKEKCDAMGDPLPMF